MKKITKKITAYKVKTEDTKVLPAVPPESLKENSIPKRDLILLSRTYKIKPACIQESMYITISDREIGGKLRPYEIFINSKNVEHFEHITCITRLLSAIFRTCDDISFAVDELLSVHNPNGGYSGKSFFISPKPKYFRSILNEIGEVIRYHVEQQKIHVSVIDGGLKFSVGAQGDESAIPVSAFMQEAIESSGKPPEEFNRNEAFLPTACPECKEHQLVLRDGCPTCLSCGYSKCG